MKRKNNLSYQERLNLLEKQEAIIEEKYNNILNILTEIKADLKGLINKVGEHNGSIIKHAERLKNHTRIIYLLLSANVIGIGVYVLKLILKGKF